MNNGTDAVGEFMLADPRTLLADADAEDVPVEERARRERARESGSGIVAYSVDDAGRTVLFTINGELFVCELGEDGVTAETRRLELTFDDDGERQYATPILNPRVSPDGTRSGVCDRHGGCGGRDRDRPRARRVHRGRTGPRHDARRSGGIRRCRGDGPLQRFLVGPDSRTLLVECFDSAAEPFVDDQRPGEPGRPGMRHRYPARVDAERRGGSVRRAPRR